MYMTEVSKGLKVILIRHIFNDPNFFLVASYKMLQFSNYKL